MNQQTRFNETEPWLRGSLSEVPVVARAALHALELAKEEFERWAYGLTDEELNRRPFGIAPISFHLRHVARSLDRLLTYAEGQQLNLEQIALLKAELEPGASRTALFQELTNAFELSAARIRGLASLDLDTKREVGSKKLPTTLGGLLVHVADHTQRHVGQMITTAKILSANRRE